MVVMTSLSSSGDAVAATLRRPLTTAKIRIALVGCGAATRELHMPVLSGHDGVEIAALVDRDANRASELARIYGVSTVLTDVDRLSSQIADAAIVCTPPFHHASATIDLLRKGLHVMVEKPMATRYSDAVDMVRASDETGLTLVVTVFRRLVPATRLLRGLLDAELLGRPLSFEIREGEVYSWPTATLGNMRRDLAGGGVLIDFGSHTFDRLLYLFNGPAEVIQYRDNSRGGIESDCEVRLRIVHKGRTIEGEVELSRTRNLDNIYRIRCERGTLELKAGERFRVTVRPNSIDVRDPLTHESRSFTIDAHWTDQDETAQWYDSFRNQLDDWLDSLRTGATPSLNGATVLPSLKLINDCYERKPLPIDEPWVEEGLWPSTGVHHGSGTSRRVLVTGATGFIGGRVCEALALRDGWEVRALVHNPARASRLARLPVEMVVADLKGDTDASQLVKDCDAVVHCAVGNVWGERKQNFDVTVGGTRQLAEAALAARIPRFVNLSTIAVHDLSVGGLIDESTPPDPPRENDYSCNKAEADRVVERASAAGLCAVTLQLANVYGPYSTIFTTRPISHLVRNRLVLVGPAADLPSSTVYVDNVVEAIACALAAPRDKVQGQLFTISDGDDLSWADFFGYFACALGVPLRTTTDESYALRRERDTRGIISKALTPIRGAIEVAKSPELWALTKRVLKTEPLFSAGKWTLNAVPGLGRPVSRWMGMDAPITYRPEAPAPVSEDFEFELTRKRVSNALARQTLGLSRFVSRARAMELTLAWLRYARIVP